MKLNITTDYPFWFIVFCILSGLGYSFVLYYREKKFDGLSKITKGLMATLRFLAVFFLSFLLLSPLIKTISKKLERPVVIIAQDNSESVLLNKDSAFYNNAYKKNLQQLVEKLNEKYEVKTYSFGDKIENRIDYSFNEKQTDIASLFEELETRYSNRNVGAIVIASDGLYNKGSNPLYASLKLKAPLYTIAMGDTTVKKDLILNKVEHNRLAYLGNTFPVEILVGAKELKGKSTTLNISKGNQTLFTQKIDIANNAFQLTIPVQLEAKETGLQRYRVKLSNLEEEANFSNNTQDIFIDVLDSRQEILILGDAPHPDIAAIKQSIEANQNYEVESYVINDFDKPIKGYNLVILHQLPSQNNATTKLLADIANSEIPVLYIVGGRSAINNFNNLQTGLSISGADSKVNESEATVAENFSLFTLSDELRRNIKDFPAIQSPFGTYKMSNSATPLLYQKIGIVETKNPLMLFNSTNERKIGVIAGEGLWRWRLHDYAEHNNHTIFNELIDKTVQYLSAKVDKSFFRIVSKNNFFENEAVEFDAEVYNDSYELINTPEVNITIINSDNKKFPFTFSKTFNAYRLNAGVFPVGDYKYEAIVKVGEKLFTQKGVFSISPLQVEAVNTIADHQLLYNLAKKHGGEMINANELDKLPELLNQRDDIKSLSFTENKLTDVVNLPWIFFILIALLTAEWLIRKRNGGY